MRLRFFAPVCAGALVLFASSARAETVPVLPVLVPEPRDVGVLAREIEAGVDELSHALRGARRARDLARAASLSDRLSQAHAAARRASEVRAALTVASEPATRERGLGELRTLRARVRRLLGESIGSDPSRSDGATRITVVVEPSLPPNEPGRPTA